MGNAAALRLWLLAMHVCERAPRSGIRPIRFLSAPDGIHVATSFWYHSAATSSSGRTTTVIVSTAPDMNIPEAFYTERLLLRVPVQSDAEGIFHVYAKDPEVTRFLSWTPIADLRQVQLGIARRIERHHKGSELSWVITSAVSGVLMGMITAQPNGYFVQCGFVLGRAFWNKGYMSEALNSVASWAASEPGIFWIWACCDTENHASARVLEKAGFSREGVLNRWAVSSGVSAQRRDCFYYVRAGSHS